MKPSRIIIISLAALSVTACSDWDDHYESNDGGAQQTLWETLKANPNYSDFCDVLESTRFFRHHHRTSVSYARLLQGGQNLTVLAPVNGSFNKDSLIELTQTDQGDSVVEKFFVRNHISASSSSAIGSGVQVKLLNTKHITLTDNLAGGVDVTTPNLHAKNGTLHLLGGILPYQYNLYEGLVNRPDMNEVGKTLRVYDEDYFNENASIPSGLVDGVPVYVDSVINERNIMLNRLGLIQNEDSSYIVVSPTNEGWTKAYNEANTYFKYDRSVDKRDSLQHYYTTRAMLQDAIFSNTTQGDITKELRSPQYDKNEPEYHSFKNPFEPGGILSNVEQKIALSNGVLYQTRDWSYTKENTYFQKLRTEAEYTWLITQYNDCSFNSRQLSADSISKNGYLDIVPKTATSNWTMTFRVNNTLSGKYDVCAVLLPKSVANSDDPDLKPCKFKAEIAYTDTTGSTKTFNCKNTTFKSDPLRVDTIVLAKDFQIPTCGYGLNVVKFAVKLQCNILARETSKYAREMYLDCIYLRPSTSKDE